MSHIRAIPPAPAPDGWRWFPRALLLALGVVIAVNVVLIWDAVGSFPGRAVEDDFGTSNRYDAVLDAARRQAALGWRIEARIEDGRPVLILSDRGGAPLAAATISAVAQRPLGPPQTRHPMFRAGADGVFRADAALAPAGQWDLLLRVGVGETSMTATRRVVVR